MNRNRRAVLRASAACLAFATGAHAARAAAPGYTTPGLSTAQLAQLPGISYARPLMEKPERNLVVLRLTFPPARAGSSSPNPWSCHRPSGPVTIRVTKGALRLGLDGHPARLLRAAGSLYEPAHSLHSAAENVGSVEAAMAVAVIVVPKDAPILTADRKCGAGPSR
jgi:quercetin dioxygenase-like cupin family protein